MRVRAAHFAGCAVAIAVAGLCGCRRAPVAGSDAASDHPKEVASPAGDAAGGVDAVFDAPHDVADAGSVDAGGTDASVDLPIGDTPPDTPPADTRVDVASNDAPIDVASNDAPVDLPIGDAPPDRATSDGADARPEDQPCGPQGFLCRPFACDVARGVCKTFCATNDDCFSGIRCTASGLCGIREETFCIANTECASGHCAQGVCCATACNGPCRSCALAGTVGTCTPIPPGAPDLFNLCGDGGTCNGRGGCVPGSCATDTDCGDLYLCENARCVACNATCLTSAVCTPPAICIMRNSCTYCGLADAGAGQ